MAWRQSWRGPDPALGWRGGGGVFYAQDGSFLQSTINGALELRTADQRLEAIAWHDYTFVVVAVSPVQVAVELLYSPEAADEDLTVKIEAATGHRTTAHLDWRLYLGDGSAVVVGMDAFDHSRGPGRVRVATGNVTGWLVGKVVRRSTASVRTLPVDRTVAARVRWHAAKHPDTAATCPDLAKAPSSPGQRVIVIVHGTGLWAIPMADALMKAGFPAPVYRFEHDTFVSISSNARQLATLAQRLGTQALVWVCHSRGGLVGRQATSLLCQELPVPAVQVLTFGTPHEGTPIANLAPKAIGMTYMLGFTNHGGLPYSDPVTAAFYYLTKSRETPEGIAEMRPGCGFLALLQPGRRSVPTGVLGRLLGLQWPHGFWTGDEGKLRPTGLLRNRQRPVVATITSTAAVDRDLGRVAAGRSRIM